MILQGASGEEARKRFAPDDHCNVLKRFKEKLFQKFLFGFSYSILRRVVGDRGVEAPCVESEFEMNELSDCG